MSQQPNPASSSSHAPVQGNDTINPAPFPHESADLQGICSPDIVELEILRITGVLPTLQKPDHDTPVEVVAGAPAATEHSSTSYHDCTIVAGESSAAVSSSGLI
jgi:hypothetical protein